MKLRSSAQVHHLKYRKMAVITICSRAFQTMHYLEMESKTRIKSVRSLTSLKYTLWQRFSSLNSIKRRRSLSCDKLWHWQNYKSLLILARSSTCTSLRICSSSSLKSQLAWWAALSCKKLSLSALKTTKTESCRKFSRLSNSNCHRGHPISSSISSIEVRLLIWVTSKSLLETYYWVCTRSILRASFILTFNHRTYSSSRILSHTKQTWKIVKVRILSQTRAKSTKKSRMQGQRTRLAIDSFILLTSASLLDSLERSSPRTTSLHSTICRQSAFVEK